MNAVKPLPISNYDFDEALLYLRSKHACVDGPQDEKEINKIFPDSYPEDAGNGQTFDVLLSIDKDKYLSLKDSQERYAVIGSILYEEFSENDVAKFKITYYHSVTIKFKNSRCILR